MRDYKAAMKAAMLEEHAGYQRAGKSDRAEEVAAELWNVHGVDVDGTRSPAPIVKHVAAKPEGEPRPKRKYTRKQPLERNDRKAPETLVEVKPEPRAGE